MDCAWSKEPEYEKGILVGCDARQEWLLSWWWERYSAESALPVTFVDFGMTQEALAWCAQRGVVISLPIDSSFVKPKSEIDPIEGGKWEKFYGPDFWIARSSWFKKPFACLQSPYETTLWLDLDCEILKPIDALFATCTYSRQLSLVREYGTDHLPFFDPKVYYNGGVMVFKHGVPILKQWAQASLLYNHCFWSDDNLLSSLIGKERLYICELPELYNWKYTWGMNMNAVIYHWAGDKGKEFIKNQGGIKPALQRFYKCVNRTS